MGKRQTFVQETFRKWENAKHPCRRLSASGKTPNIRAGDFPQVGKRQTSVQETFRKWENAKHPCRRLSASGKTPNIRAGNFPQFGIKKNINTL
ncbi:hypothetical protein [Bergeyella zoohelcum]|uniref:hypothetical protein n=1 Tax=Bergeyella zoohelcum TaxID=1015 RepID=UPI0011C02C4A|nr:hypothetical protein [Bergeyella zoohelcum]